MKKTSIVWLIFLCLGLSVFLVSCGKETINVSDYLEIKMSGLNGSGKANVFFDWLTLYSNIEKVNINNNLTVDRMNAISEFVESIEPVIDKESMLSNGDKITVIINYDKDMANKAGYDIVSTTVEYTVSGLADPVNIDPFEETYFIEGETYSFQGVSPYISLIISNSDADEAHFVYSAEKTNNIQLNEEIVITAKALGFPDNYVMTRDSFTVQCPADMDRYVTSFNDIPEKALEDIKTICIEYVQELKNGGHPDDIIFQGSSFFDYDFSTARNMSNARFIDAYFFYRETDNYFYHSRVSRDIINRLLIYFVMDISLEPVIKGFGMGLTDFTGAIFTLCTDNLIIHKDGTCSYTGIMPLTAYGEEFEFRWMNDYYYEAEDQRIPLDWIIKE